MNLARLDQDLMDLLEELDKALDDLAGKEENHHKAEIAYKVAYAKSVLRAEGKTVAEREANATLAAEKEETQLGIAKVLVRAARANVDRIQTRISVAQTLVKSMGPLK